MFSYKSCATVTNLSLDHSLADFSKTAGVEADFLTIWTSRMLVFTETRITSMLEHIGTRLPLLALFLYYLASALPGKCCVK